MKTTINESMLDLLKSSKGLTQEEIAGHLGSTPNTIRGLISTNRKNGVRIIDKLIPSPTGKKLYKKQYRLAKTSREYYAWAARQLEASGYDIPVILGTPRV